jgi:hypothetical protein
MTNVTGFCFVVSPLKGNIKFNTEVARALCRYCLFELRLCPIASHLYFPSFLREDDPIERHIGIRLGQFLAKSLPQVERVIYLSDKMSAGMTMDLKAMEGLAVNPISLNELVNKGYL